MDDVFLGLDLGTSGCKLIAFDGAGRVLASAARSYGALSPEPGFLEVDADVVWQQAEACFAGIRAVDLPGGRVRSLAISVMGEAMVPVDRAGNALAPAQLSADMRCTAEVAILEREIGGAAIYARTGQPLSPIYTLPKLMWWRRHRPELLDRADKLLCLGDFALLRLGLPPMIDESMAARTLCFDIGAGAWSEELLAFCGLRPEHLAPIGRSGDPVGTIPDAVAARLSLPVGVEVVLGGHDQPMGALGAGVVAPGTAMYSIGTTEALVVSVAAPQPDFGALNIPCAAHAVPGLFAALAGSQSGGRVLGWYRDTMGLPAENGGVPVGVGEMLRTLPDEPPNWPLVLPHLLGSGSVLNDHLSLGAFYGLRMDTSRSDMMLSLLEGITFEQALSLEALEAAGPVRSLRAIGGGARSPLWLQMKADILDRPVIRAAVEDAPCLAGAILGQSHVGGASVEALAGGMIREEAIFTPRPERHRLHAQRLAAYRELYAALKPLSRRAVPGLSP